MVRFGPKLERRQAVLGRIVEIGADLLVMVCTIVRAHSLVGENPSDRCSARRSAAKRMEAPHVLADLFCRQARGRIANRFRRLFRNNDAATYKVAQQAMDGTFAWVEEGLIERGTGVPPRRPPPTTAVCPVRLEQHGLQGVRIMADPCGQAAAEVLALARGWDRVGPKAQHGVCDRPRWS